MPITVNGTPESRRRMIFAQTAIASAHALLTLKKSVNLQGGVGVRGGGGGGGVYKGRGEKTLHMESLEKLI